MNSELMNDTTFLITTNNKKICIPWQKALENDSMSLIYDNFNEQDKENIQDNISKRSCVSINNVSQCFTTSGELEKCDQIQNNQKKELSDIMKNIDAQNNTPEKIAAYKDLEDSFKQKSEQIDSLIKQYTSRQEMLKMNSGYHKMLDKNISSKRVDENKLGKDLDNIDNLKNFMVENIKTVRSNQFWYERKNTVMITILRILLAILILMCIIYILGSKTIWNSSI
jgi:hypothetical protein